MIYLLDGKDRDATLERLGREFAAVPGVEAVLTPDQFHTVGQLPPTEDPRSPDLYLSAADGYSFSGSANGDALITPAGGNRGAHGYLTSHPLMYAGFVAAGAGIRPGVVLDEISNLDVAPTMAAVLGLKMKNTDGRVLTEALQR
jgi:hypothetical protein